MENLSLESNKSYNIVKYMQRYNIPNLSELFKKSTSDIEWYWNSVVEDLGLLWYRKYDNVYDDSEGIDRTKWFINGKCNIIQNILDKNIAKHPKKIAFIFIDSNQHEMKITYEKLNQYVNAFAYVLKSHGIHKGDKVAIYLPNIFEAFVAFYSCAKIGAISVPIFSGFGGEALHKRLLDSKAKALITSDIINRKSTTIDLKKYWINAVSNTYIRKIITIGKSIGDTILSFNDELYSALKSNKTVITEIMDSEDPLFILYTSGTTGKPKGTIQVHGGFMVISAQQTAYLIDFKVSDILFWYADIGWITGQTWVVYGVPLIGGTAVVYEDAIDHPEPNIWCKILEKYKVTIFGIAPTAIRQFIKHNVDPTGFDFSLRILATTGERLNRDAWEWLYYNVGKGRCKLINLSGGTEIGGAILSVLPNMINQPASVGIPIPGFDADIFDDNGSSADEGYLVIKKPWPSMTRSLLDDHVRYTNTYWNRFPNVWYHGDRVKRDKKGLWYIIGRADDVIKVSGHRIEAGEIEEIIASDPHISEVAVIGVPEMIKGESIYAYAVLKDNNRSSTVQSKLKEDILRNIEIKIGKYACIDKLFFVNELPKTRTGKIVRRLIKEKVLGYNITENDLSVLENPLSIEYF